MVNILGNGCRDLELKNNCQILIPLILQVSMKDKYCAQKRFYCRLTIFRVNQIWPKRIILAHKLCIQIVPNDGWKKSFQFFGYVKNDEITEKGQTLHDIK